MKKVLIALFITVIVIGLTVVIFFTPLFKSKNPAHIRSFEDCAAAGFLVVDTKPRECHTKTGQVFHEVYNQVLLKDYIVVTEPKANSTVSSPFKIEGKAKGAWYFNNQIFVKLIEENGRVIATVPLKALSSTDTKDFVPFVAAVNFSVPETEKGRLEVEKTNPHDREGENGPLIIPVRFAK